MKLKNNFFYTIRDDIKDEDSKSGNLLVRSGFIKKEASGVYMFMPFGLRVKKKIEALELRKKLRILLEMRWINQEL